MVKLWIPVAEQGNRRSRRSTAPTKPPYWEIGNQALWMLHRAMCGTVSSAEMAGTAAHECIERIWYQVGEAVLSWAITPHKHNRATKSKAGTTHRPFRLRSVPISIGKRGRLLMILAMTLGPATTAMMTQRSKSPEGESATGVTAEAMALMARRHQPAWSEPFDTDSVPIQIDNGATRTMSFARSDFISGTLKPTKASRSVLGYGGTRSPITHEGTVRWRVLDDTGHEQTIEIPNSLYVPTSSTRLLSPQHMAQEARDHHPVRNGTWCATYDTEVVLHWNQQKHKLSAPLDSKGTNVGTAWTAPGYQKHEKYCQQVGECSYFATASPNPIQFIDGHDEMGPEETTALPEGAVTQKGSILESGEPPMTVSVIREGPATTTFDLDGPESATNDIEARDAQDEHKYLKDSRELLMWHTRLSHISQNRLQRMAKMGQLPKRLSTCPVLKCQACEFGKATKRPWRTKATEPTKKSHTLPVTAPGHCVSVDQLESRLPGLVGQMKGRPTTKRYKVATVFVDQFSKLSYVHLQTSTSAAETMEAKVEFERYAATFGVRVRHYHADNGRFSDNEWRRHVAENGQRLTFCGVGAHHQNGIAEKRIRDIQDLARTSLIYANRRWPAAVDARLWPYALRNANNVINKTTFPKQLKSPIELFSAIDVAPNLTQDHPFGCPTYALDGRLQGTMKIDKWASRSRLAVYLGDSLQHSQKVGLLLSLTTGLVSPQFHAVYDDTFSTVESSATNPPSNWQKIVGFADTHKRVGFHSGINPGHESEKDIDIPLSELPDVTPAGGEIPHGQGGTDTDQTPAGGDNDNPPVGDAPDTDFRTRSGRVSRPPAHHADYVAYEAFMVDGLTTDELVSEHDRPQWDEVALAASSDPDVLYLHEAMAASDRQQFVEAMKREIDAHTESGNWNIMRRDQIPSGHAVLPAVWAMRRKRHISTQQVYKWKARLNIHGGKQVKDVNYWETYAPVASWPAIRLIMTIAAAERWCTKQLDFVLAYPQAPVETDLFMAIPTGFELSFGSARDYALRLVNNLYGQKQAGKVWNDYLVEGLLRIDFTQTKNDPCIFFRGSVIIVIYTDDTIVTGPLENDVDAAITDIGREFKITSQPKVDDFLGVKITRLENDLGTEAFTLTQPQLVNSILKDLGLEKEGAKSRPIPALSSVRLHRHEGSAPHNEDEWSYRSVVGKMNYLEKSTRPDIAYAVHQCARFASDPKVQHTAAVKLIGRYLAGTRDRGIICNTSKDKSFECYCDAGFSGDWKASIAENDSSTARSRTGYVIMYSGCPIVWASKMQTEIALSTTESEYVALSQSLRDVIPLMALVVELEEAGFPFPVDTPKVHCKTFEDNSGALEMAKVPKMRPRTRHLNIKYHHFREHVKNGDISIHAISTDDQMADIFTKPLDRALFSKHRMAIMGW